MIIRTMLLRERGVSYIQILLASSVIAGLAVVGLKMMKNQERLAKLSSQKFEISYLVNEMSFLLKDPLNCEASFKSLDPRLSVRKINSLKKELRGGKHREASYYLKYFTFDSSKKLYGSNDVKILKYHLSDKKPGVSVDKGSTNLVVTFEIDGDAEKPIELNKFIPLQVKTDGKGIASCELFNSSSEGFKSSSSSIYIGAGLYVGDKRTEDNQLSVRGSLTILPTAGEFPPCSEKRFGALMFMKKYDDLFFCTPNGIWGTLGKLPNGNKKGKTYIVKALDENFANLMTERHRVCLLTEFKSNEKGTCNVVRLEEKGITNWKIMAQFASGRGGQYCTAECFN